MVRHSPEGRRLIVREFHPGETFNEVGALDAETNMATAVAGRNDTLALILPGDVVRELVARYPVVGNEMMQAMAHKLRFAMTRVSPLGLMDVKARLCAWLLDNMDAAGVVTGTTQEELASEIGTVRQVLGRALGELRNAKLVEVHRGTIKVLDAAAVRRIAQ